MVLPLSSWGINFLLISPDLSYVLWVLDMLYYNLLNLSVNVMY